jgi:hypothetical protein
MDRGNAKHLRRKRLEAISTASVTLVGTILLAGMTTSVTNLVVSETLELTITLGVEEIGTAAVEVEAERLAAGNGCQDLSCFLITVVVESADLSL